ncbi:MAG: ribosome small subunit-dependent GTPase A [Desulfuromonadales bacterium]|nr:ribosome small subunit-dependent GTPase A [Desulfuromonadales bacterium]
MSEPHPSLSTLGWEHFFQQQLTRQELAETVPVRVFAAQGNSVDVVGATERSLLSLPGRWKTLPPEDRPTVGDWLLLGSDGQPVRLLDRKSVFCRNAAGQDTRVQLLAANVDTLFIVSSCNRDFNPSRLERYLALALEAGVEPVMVLTKVDLSDDPSPFVIQARQLRPGLLVETINSKNPASADMLRRWCGVGRTVALVGSSGVGKSTLINTLLAETVQETGAIREDDSRGRHTTTARTLHLLPGGGLLLDSPGMRELQLGDCENGIASLFAEIAQVARRCRFSDCRHQGDPGCAVQLAVDAKELDPRRLNNYLKLLNEQERNAETLVDKHRRKKDFGKSYKKSMAAKLDERSRY